MQLNSLVFVLLYLPIFIGLMYFARNNNIRNFLILVFSVAFYALNDLDYLWLLLSIILFTYLVSKNIKDNKALYIIYLIILVLILAIFKYGHNFNINNLVMPVGISFYIFTSISYISDVYYEKIDKENNLLNLFIYLTFFPTILSGPILRYKSFRDYIDNKEINANSISNGFRRFIIGLFKKTVIANQLAVVSEVCFTGEPISFPLAWLGSLCFMIQLYYDFSAYSDMAIGIGEMIGFKIPENFNNPYISTSIREFWHRWHISLSSWFKDYVYIPLGGSKVPFIRWLINILIVWSLTGIWHGSTINFLIWGLWNALFLIFEKICFNKIKLPNFLKWLFTFLIEMIGFTIFNSSSLESLKLYLLSMTCKGESFSIIAIERLDILYLWPYIMIGLLFIIPKVKDIFYSLNDKFPILYDGILVLLLIVSIVFIINSNYVSFIYVGF